MIGRLAAVLIAVSLAAGSEGFAAGAKSTAADASGSTSGLFLGFQTKSPDPINVAADTLEVYDEGAQRVSLFSGGVVVTRGPTTMKAATMKLFSSAAESSTNGFTRIEADGKIYVASGDQTVTGDRAVVDNLANTITVIGNVVLSQAGSVITGSRLVVDMTTGRARVEQDPGKQIRGVFAPGAIGMSPASGAQ